jgi:hypothetical protein
MTQAAKAQEPSMEEILASIRRIIADDDSAKPAAKPSDPAPAAAARPEPPPPPVAAAPAAKPTESVAMNQDDIDAMLAGFDAVAAEPEPEPVPAPAAPQPDILELTEAMAAPAAAAPASFRKIDPQPDVVFSEPPRARPPEPEFPRAPAASLDSDPRWGTDAGDGPLLSAATSAALDSAFGSLSKTVLVQSTRTLEDLVRDMLRPMLKQWLDENLPGMVERMIRAEIERVSRGRS